MLQTGCLFLLAVIGVALLNTAIPIMRGMSILTTAIPTTTIRTIVNMFGV